MANSVRYAEELGDKHESIYTTGYVHYLVDRFTFTVAAGTTPITIFYGKMPAGRLIILPYLSRLNASDGDATADLHVGYAAYTSGATGLVVAADDNFFMDNVDIGAGAIDAAWTAVSGVTTAGAQPAEFNTRDGFQLTVLIDTADMNPTDIVELQVAYLLIN